MQNAVMVPHECLKMLWLWNVVIENNHHCSWKGELLVCEEKNIGYLKQMLLLFPLWHRNTIFCGTTRL